MREKRRKWKDIDHNQWIVTFSDLLRLLLIFLILLVAISNFDKNRLKITFGVFNNNKGINDPPPLQSTLGKGGFRGVFSDEIKNSVFAKNITIIQDKRGIVLILPNEIIFNTGSTEIKTDAVPMLNYIGDILTNENLFIRIEGHVYNIANLTGNNPSNWNLSITCAINTLDFFMKKGILPERMSASGYGDSRPIYNIDTEEGRKKNNRLEIILLEKI